MRVIFLALLLVNLLYMGWAKWIDVPGPPPPNPIAGLPRLTLASELSPQKRAALARKMALETAPQCVSVGPFDDPGIASQAAALLKAKSFAPQQRTTESPAVRRFWVYLDGFASDAAVTGALHKLERGGIDDAEAMPPVTGGRRISLGLFNDRDDADRRAKVVRTMGFTPEVTQRMLPGTVYWLDLKMPAGSAPVPLKDVSGLAPDGQSTPISVQSCPTGAAPATTPAVPAQAPATSSPGPGPGQATLPRPAPASARQKDSPASSSVSAVTLPRCKPGGGGPVPCVLLKEAKQPSVL